jgi:hypothetical protein
MPLCYEWRIWQSDVDSYMWNAVHFCSDHATNIQYNVYFTYENSLKITKKIVQNATRAVLCVQFVFKEETDESLSLHNLKL